MNKNLHKLIFCRVRRMVVAVAEFATSHATEPGSGRGVGSLPVLRAVACAAMVLLGTASTLTLAQIVPSAGSGAQVLQTQNGLQQVNIAKPSAAGVSLNNYSQFDVPGKGAILNNSPTIVQTQQAGYVNGNPNLAPGQSAGIIVNQVLSNSPSQLRGYLEVAGPKAEVVVANPSGIVVDGGGFINTSRAILTTGTPNFGANGSLAGFNVAGGNITVQGAGLNATNVDQVDLLARALQLNAAIYANNLNVVTGANQVDHTTLTATPIAGNGAAPAFAIDVSQLGGMYANRIYLASNEYGVGVSNRGVLAAQAGDLTLTSQGKLVLAGQTNASGSISATARDGIDNSGTTYAQQDVVASTSGAVTNSGVLAAQRNTTLNAGSVASTGTLGAGVNSDGSISTQGDLNVIASGAVSATGRNEGGGNTVIQGASVTVSKLPDTKSLLDKQGDMMNAASAAGEAVATQTGAIANAERDSALKEAKAAYERGDLDAMQSALDTADSWKEGGAARTALHVAGGGLIGGLGGGGIGTAAQGAAGAGMSAYLANRTQQFADAIAGETGSKLVGNIAGNVVSTLGGGIIGGTAGAAAASNVNLYNQSNNKKESEAANEAKELRALLDKERAMLGQKSVQTADTGAATVQPPVGALGGKDANSSFWSSTKDKTPVENAYGHSIKHGGEFPEYQNSVQYVQSAQEFVNDPPAGTLTKTRPNGDTLLYDPSSNTFAVETMNGAPKTMFRPDPAQHGYPTNLDYFNAQK